MLSYEQEKKLELILNLIQVPEQAEMNTEPLTREFGERERDEKGRFVSREVEELESNFNEKDYKWAKTGPNTWELVPRLTIGDIITISVIGLIVVGAISWL